MNGNYSLVATNLEPSKSDHTALVRELAVDTSCGAILLRLAGIDQSRCRRRSTWTAPTTHTPAIAAGKMDRHSAVSDATTELM